MIHFQFDFDEVRFSLEQMAAVLEDKTVLTPFAQRLKERAKRFVEGQGEGSWPPFAKATQEKRENTGTSAITKHGDIRASKVRRIQSRIKALQKRTHARGMTDRDRKNIQVLRDQVTKLQIQESKAQGKTYSKRKTGKSVAETRKMMPRMPGTIRTKAQVTKNGAEVVVYSKAGLVGAAHHYGLGKNTKRTIIPDVTEEDIAFASDLIEAAAVKLFEDG